MAMTKDEKKFWVDQGIKIALVGFAAYSVSRMFGIGTPGRVDRIPFDLEKTQNRYMPTGNPPPNDFDVIADPWDPSNLARRLHSAMKGIQLTDGERLAIWDEVRQLGTDRARWLHNYWLAQIDHVDTLYRWINGEMMDWGNEEGQQQVLQQLTAWGVGF